jgi:fatty acid-binding protein DegV
MQLALEVSNLSGVSSPLAITFSVPSLTNLMKAGRLPSFGKFFSTHGYAGTDDKTRK